jgi:pyrroloquinoline quinone biosynthesis protein B
MAKTKLMVLGSGQDGGIPHTGCYCPTCTKARRYSRCRRLGPSIAVHNRDAGFCYLIDASPDFKVQLDMIHRQIPRVRRKGKIPISGILLTHAHYGHCTGLLQLGKEVLNEAGVPVYCSSRMMRFLSTSDPYRHLVRDKCITLREVHPGKRFTLDGIRFTPTKVPHRTEIADTVGYTVEASKRLFHLPDTDHWTDELVDEIGESDIALIDGTFYSRREVPRFAEIPHPPVSEAIRTLKDMSTEIYFTHINHTNPLNRPGPERRRVESKGLHVAYDGMVLGL